MVNVFTKREGCACAEATTCWRTVMLFALFCSIVPITYGLFLFWREPLVGALRISSVWKDNFLNQFAGLRYLVDLNFFYWLSGNQYTPRSIFIHFSLYERIVRQGFFKMFAPYCWWAHLIKCENWMRTLTGQPERDLNSRLTAMCDEVVAEMHINKLNDAESVELHLHANAHTWPHFY